MRIKQRVLSLLLAGALLVPGLPAAEAAPAGRLAADAPLAGAGAPAAPSGADGAAGGAERPDLKPRGMFLHRGRRIWIRLPLFYFVKNFTLAAQKFDNYRELEKRREIPIKV